MSWALGGGKVPGDHCLLETVCVHSSFRGRGIGKALMDKAEDAARNHACHVSSVFLFNSTLSSVLYSKICHICSFKALFSHFCVYVISLNRVDTIIVGELSVSVLHIYSL